MSFGLWEIVIGTEARQVELDAANLSNREQADAFSSAVLSFLLEGD